MRSQVTYAMLGLFLFLPPGGQGSPPDPDSAPPAPASRPAGIPLTLDERRGILMIGARPVVLLPELFLFDGKKTLPAPTHLMAGNNIRIDGFTGKYPVPVGAAVSGPAAHRMWGVYAGATLDASAVDRSKMKGLMIGQVLGSRSEVLALVSVSLAEESKFYVSPQYVVHAAGHLKVAENGPFATVTVLSGGSGVTLARNSARVEAGRSEDHGAVSYRLEKVRLTDLLEWEIAGEAPAKGSFCPIYLGAEEGFVEYIVATPPDQAVSAPAVK